MANPVAILSQDLPPRLPVLRAVEAPARPNNPEETLELIAEAAQAARAMQQNMDYVGAYTRELLVRIRDERAETRAELRTLRRQVQDWQQKALAGDAKLKEFDQVVRAESRRRAEAEAAAFEAIRRADAAEARCQEIEGFFVQIFNRFPQLPDLLEAELTEQPSNSPGSIR